MKQEEKELLLKVLCAMLPYYCHFKVKWGDEDYNILDVGFGRVTLVKPFMSITSGSPLVEEVKPYLRPMSSMSEEEKERSRWYQQDAKSDNFILYMNRYAEWLDSNHFDWRTDGDGKTMIELGLALEAPEGMYNTKTEQL